MNNIMPMITPLTMLIMKSITCIYMIWFTYEVDVTVHSFEYSMTLAKNNRYYTNKTDKTHTNNTIRFDTISR